MKDIDWGCLAVQVAITGIAFYLVNMLILFKDKNGDIQTIRRDDHNLFLSLLLAILVGYWATTYIKPDCVSVPYTKQEGKENWNLWSPWNPTSSIRNPFIPGSMDKWNESLNDLSFISKPPPRPWQLFGR
jgi:hypothetical protein